MTTTIDFRTTSTFEPADEISPLATRAREFIMKLTLKGSELGYLGEDASGWGVVAPETNAVVLIEYHYNGQTYYRKAQESNSYLSVSNTSYVGFYGWWGASSFVLDSEGHLVSSYNGQKMSYNHDTYLRCFNEYSVVHVEFVYI